MAVYSQEQTRFENERPYEDVFVELLTKYDSSLDGYRDYLGQDDHHRLYVIVLHDPEIRCSDPELEDIYCRAADTWDSGCIRVAAGGICVIIGRGYGDGGDAPAPEELSDIIAAEHATRGRSFRTKICAGRPVASTDLIIRSLSDAFSACGYSSIHKSGDAVVMYEDLGVLRILFGWDNRIELRSIYYNKLEEIDLFDKENNTEYFNTIVAFCKCAFSVNATARRMHMHYNTIVARLNRLKDISGFDLLDDARAQFDAYACVMIYFEYAAMKQFVYGLAGIEDL